MNQTTTNQLLAVEMLRRNYVRSDRDDQLNWHLDHVFGPTANGELASFTSTGEARGIAVIAAPGDGKTSLIHNGLKTHPSLSVGNPSWPTRYIHVTVPNPATLKSLGCEILKATGYPSISTQRTAWNIWDMVRARLEALQIAVLWIDEAHDLFVSASDREANDILKMLKTMMQGKSPVSVLLSGTEKLWNLLSVDPQVQRRFTVLRLNPLSPASHSQWLARLVNDYCARASLGAPRSDDLVYRIMHASRYLFGRCIETVVNAIEDAARQGQSDLKLANFAFCYEQAENCGDGSNVFIVEKWRDIDPDESVRDLAPPKPLSKTVRRR